MGVLETSSGREIICTPITLHEEEGRRGKEKVVEKRESERGIKMRGTREERASHERHTSPRGIRITSCCRNYCPVGRGSSGEWDRLFRVGGNGQ